MDPAEYVYSFEKTMHLSHVFIYSRNAYFMTTVVYTPRHHRMHVKRVGRALYVTTVTRRSLQAQIDCVTDRENVNCRGTCAKNTLRRSSVIEYRPFPSCSLATLSLPPPIGSCSGVVARLL